MLIPRLNALARALRQLQLEVTNIGLEVMGEATPETETGTEAPHQEERTYRRRYRRKAKSAWLTPGRKAYFERRAAEAAAAAAKQPPRRTKT